MMNSITMVSNSKTRYATLGSSAFFLFGMLLLIIGGRLILYQHLLISHGHKITGTIIDSGSVRSSSGGTVNYIRYQFSDDAGKVHAGQSSRYSGVIGETVLIEYSPIYPFIHRLSGEGRNAGYTWRWAVFCAGLLFSMAGIYWFFYTLNRFRLAVRLSKEGLVVKGTVKQITDNGRTITYLYTTDFGSFRGKTLPLPKPLVREYAEKDHVEVLYDPAHPKRSVLKIEL